MDILSMPFTIILIIPVVKHRIKPPVNGALLITPPIKHGLQGFPILNNADLSTDAKLGLALLVVETLNSIFKRALSEPTTLNEDMPAPVLESNQASEQGSQAVHGARVQSPSHDMVLQA